MTNEIETVANLVVEAESVAQEVITEVDKIYNMGMTFSAVEENTKALVNWILTQINDKEFNLNGAFTYTKQQVQQLIDQLISLERTLK